MTIKEILAYESANFDSIVLYREGLFWRAYERSAYNFVKHIKAFLLTKKYIKKVQTEVVYLGFPDSSLSSILLYFTGKSIEQTDKQIVCKYFIAMGDEFIEWKNNIHVKISAQNSTLSVAEPLPGIPTTNNVDENARLVTDRILKFAVANKSPVECQQFIIELQNQLNGTI